jgi:hypothetical protein
MKTWIVCITALLTLAMLLPAGAGGGAAAAHDALVKDMLGDLEQIHKVLLTIKDEPSADAARPDLKKVALHLAELRKRAKEVKQPSKAEKDELEKRYKPKFDEALKKLRVESIRVKGVPGGPEALNEIKVVSEKKKQ